MVVQLICLRLEGFGGIQWDMELVLKDRVLVHQELVLKDRVMVHQRGREQWDTGVAQMDMGQGQQDIRQVAFGQK